MYKCLYSRIERESLDKAHTGEYIGSMKVLVVVLVVVVAL